MNERTGVLTDIFDILKGDKKPTAEIITSADETWNSLALSFWLYGLLAFVIGIIAFKLLDKK